MKNKNFLKIALFFLLTSNIGYGQIYQHDFGTITISGKPYTVAPGTFNANLSNSSWTTSDTEFRNFAGSSGQALSLNNSSGTPTYTLTFDVASGFKVSITQFSFWRQRSTTGAQNWSMTINGIAAGSGTVPTTGASTGSLDVTNTVENLTGTVTVILSMSGASGTGTFRLDDFTLIGAVDADVAPGTPGITLTPVTGNTTEAGGTATFTAVLNSQPTDDVVLNISSADTGEVTVAPATLTFTNANWNVAQTVTLTGVDDLIFDGNQSVTIFVAVDDALSDNAYNGIQTTTSVINEDDEVEPFVSGKFVKITDVSEIVDNAFYVLIDKDSESFAMNNIHSTFLANTSITPVSNTITDPLTSIVWDIKTDGGGKSIFNAATSKYVSYTGNDNNIQVVDDVTTDNNRWTIAFVVDEFHISNLALPTRRLQYNSGSPRFAAYTGSQRDISLYKLATTTWSGNTSTDWATAGNWSNGVPTGSTHAIIPEVANAPIISASTNAAVYDLTITEADGLVINSGGSLIVNGTSTGNVTYNRNLGTENWYLASSPVAGETYDNAYVAANSLAINGANNAIATYLSASNTWSYMQTNGGSTFTAGTGYSVRRANASGAGNLSFTGTINTSNVSVALSNAGTGFNLLGNPFTSFIHSETFLTDNTGSLVTTDIWVYNQNSGSYEVKNLASAFVLAPAQGFFVRADAATNINILESYQRTTGNAFQKSARPEIQISMTDGTNNRFAKIYYLGNATTGYDNGYDGETFGGIANATDIFTHLVSNSEGKKYQIQSLPNADFETMVIPVGIISAAGKEITFSLEAMNLPEGLKVFLEDRLMNTITRLDEANTSYKVTLTESLNGIGRFYLHTKASGVLSTTDVSLENVSVYSTGKNELRVVGLSQGKASLKLFNILGKQVFASSFNANGVQDLNLPTLSTGIYVVQLETENGKLNKKITLE